MSDPGAELTWHTPAHWAGAVLAHPAALLSDHAHLEQAAATNALALVRRWPDEAAPHRWVARLSRIASEESEHLGRVSRALADRGGALSRGHDNPYATALRTHVDRGTPRELADRCFVSALIELRSWERFGLLAATDHDLAPLYADLQHSEAGHHRVFVRMAEEAGGTAERWRWWRDREGEVASSQPFAPRIHAGPPERGRA